MYLSDFYIPVNTPLGGYGGKVGGGATQTFVVAPRRHCLEC